MKIKGKIIFDFLILLIHIRIMFCQSEEDAFGNFLKEQQNSINKLRGSNKNTATDENAITDRIIQHYFRIFQVLDNNSDGVVSKQELEDATLQFQWPKKEIKDNMTFKEFCEYMEGLWDMTLKDPKRIEEGEKYEKSFYFLKKAFDFIDMHKQNKITKDQLLKGLSAFLGTDIKENDVKYIFSYYNNDYITEEQLKLAIANGMLDNSLENVLQIQELSSKIKPIE